MVAPPAFKPLMAPKSVRPLSAFRSGKAGFNTIIRDQLSLTSWLCLGAIAQGILILAVGRLAILPPLAVMFYRAVDTYAMTVGWKRNSYMDDVIKGKISVQFPNEHGEYGSKPASEDVVVFLIGTRCNHPLGLLAPGTKEIMGYFMQMTDDLDTHADEFDFLGMTSWINNGARETQSELLVIGYFKSNEGLQKFAHSEYHRKGWEWFNKIAKTMTHHSIYHETYHVPKQHYEAIYVNSHASGVTSTNVTYTDPVTNEVKWASPIVDATKGLLRTSAGRMNRSKGDEHDKYGRDPWQ